MFEIEMLGVLIFFVVAIFDNYKKTKFFFFIVIGVGALLGAINITIPMFVPENYIEATKTGIYTALVVSGLFGHAKKKMVKNKAE